MGYKVYRLQNTPKHEKPSIMIQEGDSGWETAYEKWLNGKNPTDSNLWERGIFALTMFHKVGW